MVQAEPGGLRICMKLQQVQTHEAVLSACGANMYASAVGVTAGKDVH